MLRWLVVALASVAFWLFVILALFAHRPNRKDMDPTLPPRELK